MDERRGILREELQDSEARSDYARILLDSSVALQIKALRQQRGWTQEKLAGKAGLKQSQVSAMEQVTFSSWTIATLRKLARAFDLVLSVRFQSFGWLLENGSVFKRTSLERPSFDDDPAFKTPATCWASAEASLAGDQFVPGGSRSRIEWNPSAIEAGDDSKTGRNAHV